MSAVVAFGVGAACCTTGLLLQRCAPAPQRPGRARGGGPVTRPLRVLQVHAHGADPAVGGVGKHLTRLGLRLPERGFEVYYLASFEEATPPPGPTVTLHHDHWTHQPRAAHPQPRGRPGLAADPAARGGRARVGRRRDAHPQPAGHDHGHLGGGPAARDPGRAHGSRLPAAVPAGHAAAARRRGLPAPTRCSAGRGTRRLARWSDGVQRGAGPDGLRAARPRRRVLARDHARGPQPLRRRGDASVRIPPPRRRLEALGYLGRLDHTKGVRQLLAAAPALARPRLQPAHRGRRQAARPRWSRPRARCPTSSTSAWCAGSRSPTSWSRATPASCRPSGPSRPGRPT